MDPSGFEIAEDVQGARISFGVHAIRTLFHRGLKVPFPSPPLFVESRWSAGRAALCRVWCCHSRPVLLA